MKGTKRVRKIIIPMVFLAAFTILTSSILFIPEQKSGTSVSLTSSGTIVTTNTSIPQEPSPIIWNIVKDFIEFTSSIIGIISGIITFYDYKNKHFPKKTFIVTY
jgi:hypothetical protein